MDILVSFIAQYFIFIVASGAIIITIYSNQFNRNRIIALAILAFILGFIFDVIAGSLYYSPRPFVVEHIPPLFPHAPDNGFPSDHTLAAMIIAGVIFVYRRNLGILLGVFGILIGISRVIAQVHHPIDIISSIILAAMAVVLAWLLLMRLERYSWWVSLSKYFPFSKSRDKSASNHH